MIGRRLTYQGFVGTIRYEGPIVHEDRGDDIWYGIEWDDVTRGRHNGTVQGHVYFTTHGDHSSGSLLKKDKVELGVNILDAIFLKYFKEIPQQLNGILDDEIIKQLQEHDDSDSVVVNSLQQQEETKTEENIDSKVITVASQKQVLVEFDSNAYFETGRKKKKMVEFYGFDEIWQKINNLRTLKELSLQNLQISSIGRANFLGTILQNLRILSLENNLIYSWHQVFLIGRELRHLRCLSLSHNQLRPLETLQELQISDTPQEEEQKSGEPTKLLNNPSYRIRCLESKKILEDVPKDIFKDLQVLILINMKLNWQELSKVFPAFLGLNELVVCRNVLTDYNNLKIETNELQLLQALNLEDTGNSDFSKVQSAFGSLPQLAKLCMNRNGLQKLCKIDKFQTLTSLSLEHNELAGVEFLAQLAAIPNLTSLNLKHNPLQEKMGREYVRQRATAEIGTLQVMNGSNLSKFERKDAEIFYLKSAFEQYFLLKQVPHYFYDYDDFLVYASENHPRIPYLIQKFGNPYEIDPTVKGDPRQAQKQQAPKVQYCTVKLIALSGKMKGKAPIPKKFMTSTGIFPIKQVVSKLMTIPLKSVQLSIKVQINSYRQVDQDSPLVPMDEKDRTLDYYGAVDNTEIYVEEVTAA